MSLDQLRLRGDVEPRHARAARRRREQSDEHADRCRLSRAVRAEESEYLAGRDVEGDAVHRCEGTETARQAANLDDGFLRHGRAGHAATGGLACISAMKTSSMPGSTTETRASPSPRETR